MRAAAGPGPAGPLLGAGSGSGSGSVALAVTSSLNAFRTHKRYGTGLTIAEFKCKLELVVGSPASCMDLELYSAEEEPLGRLDCDEALLGSYPVADGCRVHVIDRSGARIGEYEDVSQVEKYEMAESDYEKRPESLRSFLRQRRWGRYDAEGTRRRAAEEQQRRAQEAALAAALPLGARCQVRVPGQPCKRATVMYVGQTDFKPGYWVGVRYDEPLGKHDGSVGGRRYFECQPKYGAFVKPQSVTPGDFPEEDDGLEDELAGIGGLLSWYRNGLLATGVGVISYAQSDTGRDAAYGFFILGGLCVSYGAGSYLVNLVLLRRPMMLPAPTAAANAAAAALLALLWLCALSLYVGRLEVEIVPEEPPEK